MNESIYSAVGVGLQSGGMYDNRAVSAKGIQSVGEW